MAPTRVPAGRRPISTRTGHKTTMDGNTTLLPTVAGKRKADASPLRTEKVKRSALGNLTNAVLNYIEDGKKGASKAGTAAKHRDVVVLKKSVQTNNKTKSSSITHVMDSLLMKPMTTIGGGPQRQTKVMTRAASRASQSSVANTDKGLKTKSIEAKENANTILKVKKSNEHQGGNNNNHITVSNEKRTSRRLSNEFELNENEESHYMSALEDW